MADTPEQQVATIVTVGKDDPYPTGTPAVTNLANCHAPQELIVAAKKYNQSQANLLAAGMIAGGAMYTGP
jgi:hypothetical protein